MLSKALLSGSSASKLSLFAKGGVDQNNTPSFPNLVVTLPSGISNGDVGVLWVVAMNNTNNITPSGWTSILSGTYSGFPNSYRFNVYLKILNSSDSSQTLTFVTDGNSDGTLQYAIYRPSRAADSLNHGGSSATFQSFLSGGSTVSTTVDVTGEPEADVSDELVQVAGQMVGFPSSTNGTSITTLNRRNFVSKILQSADARENLTATFSGDNNISIIWKAWIRINLT
jgi:hypothetical protein